MPSLLQRGKSITPRSSSSTRRDCSCPVDMSRVTSSRCWWLAGRASVKTSRAPSRLMSGASVLSTASAVSAVRVFS